MVVDFAGPLLDLLDRYGLAALFVLLTLDAAMLLPLVPGELLLIVAANRFGTNLFGLALVVAVASVAATAGNFLVYGVARGAGRGFFERHPRLFLISPKTRDKLERTFQRPLGQSLALFLRLVPVARLLVSLPAGLARMPIKRFLLLSLIGNVLFHTGFMYIAYESRRPDSPIATQSSALREAYGSPAWAYVQANWALVAVAGVGLGVALSLKASHRAHRRPLEAEQSFIGFLARLVLFWGGLAVLAGLWIEPTLVYESFRFAGVDLATLAPGVPYAPASVAAAIGASALLLWFVASSIWRGARRRVKAAKHMAKVKTQLDSKPRAVHEQRLRP
jgi:membrane protein DedA with SNARE-associated domain